MTEDNTSSTTRINQLIRGPRHAVYEALLDEAAIAVWRVPPDMSSNVHVFEPREGGRFRVSLTYDSPDATGKTLAHTDTYHGRFARLVPDELVVEVLEFETSDPMMQGEMTIMTTLSDVAGGTLLSAVHTGLPAGLSAADNELGWQLSLAKLAEFVESKQVRG